MDIDEFIEGVSQLLGIVDWMRRGEWGKVVLALLAIVGCLAIGLVMALSQ